MEKQLTLDMKELKPSALPIRYLHKPTLKETKLIATQLEYETKVELQIQAEPFLALLRKYRFTFHAEGEPVEEPSIIRTFRSSQNQLKSRWVDLLSLFYNSHNFMLIIDELPKRLFNLWREVLRNHYVISSDVNKIMGANCFQKDRWGYDDTKLSKPLNSYFAQTRHKANVDKGGYYRDWDTFVYDKLSYRQELLKKFYPDLATISSCDRLPDGSNLKCYNNENIVLAKLPTLAMLYESNQLPHTINKQPASVVKKAQKALSLPDFFSNYPDRTQVPLSTSLLVNYYIFFREYTRQEALPIEPEQLIKRIFKETFQIKPYNEFTLPVLLPYLKGIKKSKLKSYNFRHVIKALLTLLGNHHDKNWLSVDQLIMGLRMEDEQNENSFLLLSTSEIDDMDLRNGFIEDKKQCCYIHLGNLVHQLSEPFVKAVLFALSTLGMVEIAYREPQAGDTSPYDGLQYVRLTELGKYALEITDSYAPQFSGNDSPAFELDDQRLLIKILHEDSPFKPLLDDYADCITPTLYNVSYESFLRNCSTRFDVEHKVKIFNQYISKKQPQVWKDFMDDIAKRCNPFGIPNDNYMILTIPKDNTDLQRLVLTHPAIRRYVLKAENYMLLIKEDDYDKFSTALKKFGYLI